MQFIPEFHRILLDKHTRLLEKDGALFHFPARCSPESYQIREMADSERLNAVTAPAEINILTANASPLSTINLNAFFMVQLYGLTASGACHDQTMT